MKTKLTAFALSAALGFGLTTTAQAVETSDILTTYADIAEATYGDSLSTAKTLQVSIEAFIAKPNDDTLKAAKADWIKARVPYQQTEAYRFGNAIVDDWEGKVNAWPLDEGLIDYVESDYYGDESDENAAYTANVIANDVIKLGGQEIDVSKITKDLLANTLHEVDNVEANVATGYHAVEFLLWGQDLNGTGPGAGNRPATDYDVNNCTNDNCEARAQYLSVVTDLLVDELTWMTAQWKSGGSARADLMSKSDKEGLATIITGMGSLSYGELAGERIKLGLMLHDPEEEHDCFSDNTAASHANDHQGIVNVYRGSYTRTDGSVVKGASIAQLVAKTDGKLADEMLASLRKTSAAMNVMIERSQSVEAYDQMIGEGNTDGNKVIQDVVDALSNQTKSIQRIAASLQLDGIEVEGSDSLDNPGSVLTN